MLRNAGEWLAALRRAVTVELSRLFQWISGIAINGNTDENTNNPYGAKNIQTANVTQKWGV